MNRQPAAEAAAYKTIADDDDNLMDTTSTSSTGNLCLGSRRVKMPRRIKKLIMQALLGDPAAVTVPGMQRAVPALSGAPQQLAVHGESTF